MARFHFAVEGASNKLTMELPDIAAAKCEAVRRAGNLICEEAGSFWNSGHFEMTVTDESGLILFALMLTGVEAPAIHVSQEAQT